MWCWKFGASVSLTCLCRVYEYRKCSCSQFLLFCVCVVTSKHIHAKMGHTAYCKIILTTRGLEIYLTIVSWNQTTHCVWTYISLTCRSMEGLEIYLMISSFVPICYVMGLCIFLGYVVLISYRHESDGSWKRSIFQFVFTILCAMSKIGCSNSYGRRWIHDRPRKL